MKKFNLFYSSIVFLLVSVYTLSVFAASNAVLTARASKKSVSVGETFSVLVSVQTPQSINAVSAGLEYSSDVLDIVSFSKETSIINFWVKEPSSTKNSVFFEGVILNPGYSGNDGKIVRIYFRAKKEGEAIVSFREGSVLANDGYGTNVLARFEQEKIIIRSAGATPPYQGEVIPEEDIPLSSDLVPLPVITEYNEIVDSEGLIQVKGKGAPNALTRLRFSDSSFKTLGEQFILWLQTNREYPADILVQNNEEGFFEYSSPDKLVAGSYNVTPALVDTDSQTEKQGFGVKVLVKQSPVVRFLVVVINILLLLVPIAFLIVIIYFIPWYSWLRMRIIRHRTDLEDAEIHVSEKKLQQQIAMQNVEKE